MTEAVQKVTSADPKNQIGEAASAIEDIKGSDDFFWDSVIRYTSAGMVALTILGQAVIALVELIGGTVKCLTPNSSFNRDQSFFINEFCDRYAPVTQYLPWVLILQALAILAPQFMWKSWFRGRLRFFFERAKTLDRDRNSQSGQYDLKNFKIMRALREEFGKSRRPWMYISYVFTLVVQLATVVLASGLHGSIFAYSVFHPTFFCPPVGRDEVLCTKLGLNDSCVFATSDPDWPFDFHVHCVLSSLITQRVVWVLNLVLLVLTALAVCIGLIWCFLRHTQSLSWTQAALFSFESSLHPDHFVAKPIWRCNPRLYRISSDFRFLFMKLQRFDAGLAKVLRDVIIADIVQKKEIHSQEEQKYIVGVTSDGNVLPADTIASHAKERALDAELNRKERDKPECLQFGTTMKTFIRRFVWHLTDNEGDASVGSPAGEEAISRTGRSTNIALDVSFGSPAGYSYLLKQAAAMVISLRFDPHYLDSEEYVKVDKYGETAMNFLKTSPNIFGLPSGALNEFQHKIHELFLNNQDKKINVIVIGPLTQAEEDRRTTLHELLNFLAVPYPPSKTEGPENQGTSPPREGQDRTPARSLLADDVTLIVLQPKAIENESKTSRKFCKFEPAKKWNKQPRKKQWETKVLCGSNQAGSENEPGGTSVVHPHQPSDSPRRRSNRVRPSPPPHPDSVEVEVQQPSQKQQEPEGVVKLMCGETECTFQVDVYKL